MMPFVVAGLDAQQTFALVQIYTTPAPGPALMSFRPYREISHWDWDRIGGKGPHRGQREDNNINMQLFGRIIQRGQWG
jgi:hypothetical protein